MAGKAEDKQILVGVIAATQNRKTVMHLQLPVLAWHAADLAASTALRDQAKTPGRRELDRASAHVVGSSQPLPQRKLGQQGGEPSSASL